MSNQKEYMKERKKEYYKEYNSRSDIREHRKGLVRENHLKRNYGITPEQHKQMFISQNGKCAICFEVFTHSKDVCVDHNHNTNQIRQLLCRNCNLMIGHSRENSQILSNGIDYLNKWNQ